MTKVYTAPMSQLPEPMTWYTPNAAALIATAIPGPR
jgi:hypothetical protein